MLSFIEKDFQKIAYFIFCHRKIAAFQLRMFFSYNTFHFTVFITRLLLIKISLYLSVLVYYISPIKDKMEVIHHLSFSKRLLNEI